MHSSSRPSKHGSAASHAVQGSTSIDKGSMNESANKLVDNSSTDIQTRTNTENAVETAFETATDTNADTNTDTTAETTAKAYGAVPDNRSPQTSNVSVYLTLSRGIARLPLLAKFLAVKNGMGSSTSVLVHHESAGPEIKIIYLPAWLPNWFTSRLTSRLTSSSLTAVLGWGRRPGTEKARALANRLGLPYAALEDGFLRSFGTGEQFPPLAIVRDTDGIYYGSRTASELENLLNSPSDVFVDLCVGHGVDRSAEFSADRRADLRSDLPANPAANPSAASFVFDGNDHQARIEKQIDSAIAKVVALGLSKYNHAPDLDLGQAVIDFSRVSGVGPVDAVPHVLVIDQTVGDMSVTCCGATGDTFKAMLAAARSENPHATILVKTHPEVSSGRKGGYLTDVPADSRIVLLREAMNPASLFALVDRVYVVSSTMGFEALLHGKKVSCFGMPWYAGWGVTDDRMVCERRSRQRSVRELFAAAYWHYTTYIDPLTHERGDMGAVIDWLAHQKLMAKRLHGEQLQGRVFVLGFARWKVYNLKPMLGLLRDKVIAVDSVQTLEQLLARSADQSSDLTNGQYLSASAAEDLDAPALSGHDSSGLDSNVTDTVIVWGADKPAGLGGLASRYGLRVLQAEDGFVRSVGLGSDMIRPLSLVLDERGVYFDARRVSDLEHLLQTGSFTQSDISRAHAVRQFIVAHGVTKYNLDAWTGGAREMMGVSGVAEEVSVQSSADASASVSDSGHSSSGAAWPVKERARARVLLVPGQVEDDASIRLGCVSIRTNLGLLQAVRDANPDAWVVYKPHPDVVSGNRRGKVHLSEALHYADHVELDKSVIDCIDACDEVHTMTSLTGFDALLRGKRVVTYGQPFYAGWGLTEDRCEGGQALLRRTRLLMLDELVAGVLLKYPIYWDWQLQGYTTCEAVLRRLVDERDALARAGQLERLRKGVVRRAWRKARVWLAAWCLPR
jgi:capsular polysaccharide export protein